MRTVLRDGFNPSVFRNRIVIIGPMLTREKRNDPNWGKTPLAESQPNLIIHAEAVSSLLNNRVIASFPSPIGRELLLFVGAIAGAIGSALRLGRRTAVFLCSAMAIIIISQVFFQVGNLVVPVVAPLAVLTLCFVFATFIYLETDLRQRNRELAQARESMQVRAEEERQRIAEDLHDETLPALSAVARMADKLSRK